MRENRKIGRHLLLALVLVLMSACGTSRKAAETTMVAGLTGTDYLEQVIRLAPVWQSVSGKVALQLDRGTQGTARVNATLRLKRDASIQLSVAPLLGIEVARLEISPDGLLLLDRLHKQYVRLGFTELSRLLRTDIDYHVLQSLFLNELFLPGKSRLSPADAGAFHIQVLPDCALLQARQGRQLEYRFQTSVTRPQLLRSDVALRNTPYGLRWSYSDFEELDGRSFPHHMLLEVQGSSSPLSLDMKLSRLSVGGDWEARTEIPSRYREMSLEDVLKLLMKK